MSKKIIFIGYKVAGDDYYNEINFYDKESLIDNDIIVFRPFGEPERKEFEMSYYNKPYGEIDSSRYIEAKNHWHKELLAALSEGRTIFLFLAPKINFDLTIIKKRAKLGRKREIKKYDNYKFLPIPIGDIISVNGQGVVFNNSIFNNLYKIFKDNLQYKAYLENIESGEVISIAQKSSRVLGAIYKVREGNLIVLPDLEYSKPLYEVYSDTYEPKSWQPEALQFSKQLEQSLIQIHQDITKGDKKTPPPEWVLHKDFETKQEQSIVSQIIENKKQIDLLESENNTLQIELEEEQILRGLLFETGKPLELAVIKGLELLGYEAENYDDGTLEIDVLIKKSPEGYRYIGECEGKNNTDISIKKYRHLNDSIIADYERDEIVERAEGILFGNPQRLIFPAERTLDFTKKCLDSAKRDNIALIKTSDLFIVARFLQDNPNPAFQKECRNAIHNGRGGIVQFPKIPKTENKV